MKNDNKKIEPSLKKETILIIEDDHSLVDLLSAKLKKEGYGVEVAYDGEEGLKMVGEIKPDIILLDILMPNMNGYEVLERMKEDKVMIPVIIISNSGQPVEIEKTKDLGAVDHLIKAQFTPEDVLEKIENFLTHRTEEAKKITLKKNIDEKVPSLGVNVLLVEDDSFLREISSKKLAKEGFTVYEATDGEQALEGVNKTNPDIVLLDIILPAVDGFEILSQIRSNPDEKIAKVPVIMLSNLGQEDDIKKAVEMGANDYLVKTHFTTEEIVAKIKDMLNK